MDVIAPPPRRGNFLVRTGAYHVAYHVLTIEYYSYVNNRQNR